MRPIATILILLLTVSCLSSLIENEKSAHEQKYESRKVSDSVPTLSEKELKLIRFLSYLTFLQTSNSNNITWYGWEKNYDGPQLDLDSIRYPLAHIGYTAAALAHRTPNYRELAVKILNDSIIRMINMKTWTYIDYYWKKTASFPDPVYNENIMYSGHLLQLLTLYESISGDFTYDTTGFDFIWNKDGDPITRMHYTTTKLAQAIYRQMNDDSSAGVSCEPGWVYTICQNHPHLGFRLYDTVRDGKTNFSGISSKWKSFLVKHALEDAPLYKDSRYFKMLYQRTTHVWVPLFASTGNDGWALAWLSSWFDENETSNFVCNGWKIMYQNKYWKPSKDRTKPGCFLDSGGYIGVRMQLNSWVATSFYPIVEKQCSSEATEKLECVYDWFENNFGKLLDTDHDGFFETYYYETDTIYSNWITANILLSLFMGDNQQTSKEFLRNIYHTKFYPKFLTDEPEILGVDYPLIRVTGTQFNVTEKSLTVHFNTEKPILISTAFEVKYPVSTFKVSSITRDGQTDGFTIDKISSDRIRVNYAYTSLEQLNTVFKVFF